MKVKLSKHAKRKIAERKLPASEVRRILKNPNLIYYDLISKTTIAMGKIRIAGVGTNLVIPFVKEGDALKVVTVYPCRELEREIKRKEGIRWVRVK